MMPHRKHMILWLMAVWMLSSICSVRATAQVNQPAAWSTTPTLSTDNYPSYQFRSTSAYTPVVGATSYTSGATYTPGARSPQVRKSGGWGDPDDDDLPIGVTPVIPVGDVAWGAIFLCAALYLAVRIYRRKKA